MNPQELRLGNIVDLINRTQHVHLPIGAQLKVVEIRTFNCSLIQANEIHAQTESETIAPYSDVVGIPLTYDLLERMGAEQFEDVQRIRINDFFQIERNMLGGVYIVDNNGVSTGVALTGKYTHCLQNLFFALTGQELTLKPETR